MAYETILEPINGQEAREILKNLMIQRIDKIPYLKVGNAFKQIVVGFELEFSAFPADCPVPTAEWQVVIGLQDEIDEIFDFDKRRLDLLWEKREKLAENLERIDKFLAKHNPTETTKDVVSDNGTPDELRINHGLKVPMLSTSPSGKKAEVLVDAGDLK